MATFSRGHFIYVFLVGLAWIGIFPFSAYAVDLDFDTVLQQALAHSYDIAIAEKNIDISRIYTDEVRALYYPTLALRMDNEYVDIFGKDDEVVVIGNYVSPYGESTFQDSVTARLVYLIYDFGIRDLKSAHAAQGVRAAKLEADHANLAVRQEALDCYAKALAVSRELSASRKISQLRREIYGYVKRLFQAGAVDLTQVEKSALDLADVMTRIDDLTVDFQAMLDSLGCYTGKTYSAGETTLSMLAEPADTIPAASIDPRRLPKIAALEEEIARKKKEYDIARKEMLPQFYLDGALSMYGNDANNIVRSLENLEGRDGRISLVAQWEIFSGFGDLAKNRRIKEELARMNLEKEKRLSELSREINTASHAYALYQTGEENHRERRAGIDRSRATLDRLARQDIWDQVTLLENDIRLIEHELNLELKNIEKAAAGLKLKFWAEGQRH